MELHWEEESQIRVSTDNNQTLVSANKMGLLSLALNLIALAKEEPGSHFHLDVYNCLEEGSGELIIEKTE